MVELVAKSPAAGLLPLRIGALTLEEVDFGPIFAVSPLNGQSGAVSKAMKNTLGLNFPAPNRMTKADAVRAVWAGHDRALVLGADPGPLAGAAVVDQSDGWTCAALEGAGARAVLARLVPVDLGDGAFGEGAAAATLIGHMNGLVMRLGPERFGLMVFRSMAGTLVHDLRAAMETVTARGG